MKHKKIILFFIFAWAFFLFDLAVAAETLDFIPAITIPGFYTAGDEFPVSADTLPKYIVAVYRYGGMFAGVVAMFMLVYAGWEWLLAGGNSSKISSAKSKISATLIALVILFGGYLLLSLISERLIAFNSLGVNISKPPCELYKTAKSCPPPSCIWVVATPEEIVADSTFIGKCMKTTEAPTPPEVVIDCMQVDFPLFYNSPEGIRSCAAYPDVASCNANSCFGKLWKYSHLTSGPLNEVCVVIGDGCQNLRHQSCSDNSDCELENNPDSRDWCCWDQNFSGDYCRPIGGPAGIDIEDCND